MLDPPEWSEAHSDWGGPDRDADRQQRMADDLTGYYTVRDLKEALAELLRDHPEWADLPVHVMDTEDNAEPAGMQGLLTHIELDAFEEEVGDVISLYSNPARGGGPK